MKGIEVFAPATVSNLGSGFDIIGFPVEDIGDVVVIKPVSQAEIRIVHLGGYGDIPREVEKNTASFALGKMFQKLEVKRGVELEIYKGIRPGSGIGSSAASAAAALTGANEWLGRPLSQLQLVELAMESEGMVSGSRHADNVAPALMGGITVVRSYNPLDIFRIEPPGQLYTVLLHPHIEVKTQTSRKILPRQVKLEDAVRQWGNVAGLIAGLQRGDYDLIGRSMEDVIVEPARARLIPGYDQLKTAAVEAGALNCSISGSGPSVLALCKGRENAEKVKSAMDQAYQNRQISFQSLITRVNPRGAVVQRKW